MDRQQLLLTKLAEECVEVAHAALKAQQFGFEDRHPRKIFTKAERLHQELNDLLAIVGMLNEEFAFGFAPDISLAAAKKDKVNKYAAISAKLGKVAL